MTFEYIFKLITLETADQMSGMVDGPLNRLRVANIMLHENTY